MLFLTNRVINQSANSKAGRAITFDLNDNNAGQSLYFCRRIEQDSYVEVLSEPFFDELRKGEFEQILLFIHGFNNLPENAIFQRAEQLQLFLDSDASTKTLVVPIIWPCRNPGKNTVEDYLSDQNAADASAYAFARAFAKFQEFQDGSSREIPCKKRIHVLAHSMGNRVLRESLFVWVENIRNYQPPLLFRSTFLVAADVVNETLENDQRGKYITMASKNVLSYFSGDDLALRASKAINARDASRRLGHTGPYDFRKVAGNVWGIDCDRVGLRYDPTYGHTYFLGADNGGPGLVFDHILQTLRLGRPLSGVIGINRQFDIDAILA